MANDYILRVEHLSKAFGENQVLTDISLNVKKGALKVLIGPSGGGKSTFLQCVNYLIHPDQGTVYLENTPVDPKSKKELSALRQQIGMIFQDFNLFDHLDAVDNVSIALRKVKKISKNKARERAMAELNRVGLADKGNLYPAQLSGGQKQRVSIARALAMDPKVLLLDEPTSALDPELIGEVLAVIKSLATEGMTMIMATHQTTFSASLADEFIFMQQGQIIEHGAPKELLAPNANTRTKAFCEKLNELTGESCGEAKA